MAGLVNSIKSAALSVAEKMASVPTESRFRSEGVLTPEEFVLAGDHLVHHCPTWQWSPGTPAKRREFLPADKQCLVTKNVPCYRRCAQMEYAPEQESLVKGDDGEEWVDTHHFAPDQDASTAMAQSPADLSAPRVANDDDDDDSAPAADMEEMERMMEECGVVEEEDSATAPTTTASADAASNVLATRTYDLNISYDKYYQVPRMWLTGYDEARKPLSVDDMYADFSADHAKKTITMESHPHLAGPPMASIHPCKHAEVMKRLMEQLAESGRELSVQSYLLVFLKFVQAVIPTIEYDYTRNVQL